MYAKAVRLARAKKTDETRAKEDKRGTAMAKTATRIGEVRPPAFVVRIRCFPFGASRASAARRGTRGIAPAFTFWMSCSSSWHHCFRLMHAGTHAHRPALAGTRKSARRWSTDGLLPELQLGRVDLGIGVVAGAQLRLELRGESTLQPRREMAPSHSPALSISRLGTSGDSSL